jgi:hypothetical protein
MELDLSAHRAIGIALASLLVLVALGWLGHAYLPCADRLLTLPEWQVLKASRAYQKELQQLQERADSLVELINARPDPVRAQLLAENVTRQASRGQPALAYPRQKLTLAAQAVSDWSMGALDRESARQALQAAIQALSTQPSLQEVKLPQEARR